MMLLRAFEQLYYRASAAARQVFCCSSFVLLKREWKKKSSEKLLQAKPQNRRNKGLGNKNAILTQSEKGLKFREFGI